MKRHQLIPIFISLLGFAGVLQAQPTDSLWSIAGEAYAQGRYQEAFDGYKSIYDKDLESAMLYYNLGNCAFRLQLYAQAIIWFERAKLLDPRDVDILYNLEMANRFCLDKIEAAPEFFLKTWIGEVRDRFSANQWAWATLLLFATAMLFLLLFFFGRSRSGRLWAFSGSLFLLLLTMSTFSFGWSRRQQIFTRDYAIVTAPVASVKSAPDREGNTLFIIHEGVKVRILDKIGAWGSIELADRRQGWIEVTLIERI